VGIVKYPQAEGPVADPCRRPAPASRSTCESLPFSPHLWTALWKAPRVKDLKSPSGRGFTVAATGEEPPGERPKSLYFPSARDCAQAVDKCITWWKKPGGFEGRPNNRLTSLRCR